MPTSQPHWTQNGSLAACTPSWWVLLYYHFVSPNVILQFICTFIRTGHICGAELDFAVFCCSRWCLVSPRTATTDRCESSCYITPQIAVTWGVEQHRPRQSRFNYLPAEPQTLRSRHPPDNFCQILLARQEALDGEGQWSRGRRLRRSKSSGITSATAQNENIFQSSVSFLNG